MMDIVMLVAGAGVGAMLRDLFVLHRGGEGRTRQQLESETPYDYALANARADNNRYRDELFTIKALKRTEADTERIRNEIDTILSDDGEEATESVYEPDMKLRDNEDEGKRRAENLEALFGYRGHPIIVNPASEGRGYVPIQQHDDGIISPTSWDARMSLEEWSKGVSKAFSKAYGAYVREDVSKDERLTEDGEERSLTKAVRDSFENKGIIRVTWRGSCGSLRVRCGTVDEIATGDGKVKEFGMRGLEIHARDVIRISKGRDEDGETLYRKGNR